MATNKTIPPHFQPDGPAHKTYFYINNPQIGRAHV